MAFLRLSVFPYNGLEHHHISWPNPPVIFFGIPWSFKFFFGKALLPSFLISEFWSTEVLLPLLERELARLDSGFNPCSAAKMLITNYFFFLSTASRASPTTSLTFFSLFFSHSCDFRFYGLHHLLDYKGFLLLFFLIIPPGPARLGAFGLSTAAGFVPFCRNLLSSRRQNQSGPILDALPHPIHRLWATISVPPRTYPATRSQRAHPGQTLGCSNDFSLSFRRASQPLEVFKAPILVDVLPASPPLDCPFGGPFSFSTLDFSTNIAATLFSQVFLHDFDNQRRESSHSTVFLLPSRNIGVLSLFEKDTAELPGYIPLGRLKRLLGPHLFSPASYFSCSAPRYNLETQIPTGEITLNKTVSASRPSSRYS